jgi:hydrogenase maturation protease
MSSCSGRMDRWSMSDTASDAPHAMVIGYGNPLRGDDGVGWVAAQKLADLVDPERVEALAVHLLTPELADPISKVDLVIFIDAAESRQPAGQLDETVVEPVAGALTSMTHHLTPQRLLGLAEQLYGRHPQARLFTITGADFGHKEDLTEPVARACETLVARVRQILTGSSPRHF